MRFHTHWLEVSASRNDFWIQRLFPGVLAWNTRVLEVAEVLVDWNIIAVEFRCVTDEKLLASLDRAVGDPCNLVVIDNCHEDVWIT